MAKRKPPAPIVNLPNVSGDSLSEDEKGFLQWLEGRGYALDGLDPLSDEALRLQALYVQEFSQHPLDVLRRIMQNPYSDPAHRMTAAKTILEYSARKPSATIDLKAKGAVVSIEPSQLSALSVSELETLEKLLEKVA